MASLSYLLLLLSVVYGAHSCDPKKIAIFTKNPLDLNYFASTDMDFKALSANFPSISSATLQVGAVTNGEAAATATLFKNQEKFDSFDIKFSQADGKPIRGNGFYKDQNAMLTYYINECGKSHATYVCDEKDPTQKFQMAVLMKRQLPPQGRIYKFWAPLQEDQCGPFDDYTGVRVVDNGPYSPDPPY